MEEILRVLFCDLLLQVKIGALPTLYGSEKSRSISYKAFISAKPRMSTFISMNKNLFLLNAFTAQLVTPLLLLITDRVLGDSTTPLGSNERPRKLPQEIGKTIA